MPPPAPRDALLERVRDDSPLLAALVSPSLLRHLGSTVHEELGRALVRALMPDDAHVVFASARSSAAIWPMTTPRSSATTTCKTGIPTRRWRCPTVATTARCHAAFTGHGFARARCGQCGHDFLIAFSCKGRGVCPSCNAPRMVATAAHLTDHARSELPLRQWVRAEPKCLRCLLQRDPKLPGAAVSLFLRAVESCLRVHSPGSGPAVRLGAIAFIHRYGASLNALLFSNAWSSTACSHPLRVGCSARHRSLHGPHDPTRLPAPVNGAAMRTTGPSNVGL